MWIYTTVEIDLILHAHLSAVVNMVSHTTWDYVSYKETKWQPHYFFEEENIWKNKLFVPLY